MVHHVGMKKYLFGGVAILLLGVSMWALPVYGGTFELRAVESFVDVLIERGIIPASFADRARSVVKLLGAGGTEENAPITPQNADKVKVSVSQFIEKSHLTFSKGEDVRGIVLLVKNSTTTDITLEAKRRCQVIYRIYQGDTLAYDSSTAENCKGNERVTYVLPGSQTRMFPVTHHMSTRQLESGAYRFVVEYPGYGSGERTVTIE